MLRLTLQCVTFASDMMIQSKKGKLIRIIFDGIGIIRGVFVTEWVAYAKQVFRAEMHRKGMSYADLVKALGEAGVKETEANLRNKVSRGSFTAAFMFQCLHVMGVKTLHMD